MTFNSDTIDFDKADQSSVVTRPLDQNAIDSAVSAQDSANINREVATPSTENSAKSSRVVPRSWQGIVTALPLALVDVCNVGTSVVIASVALAAFSGVSTLAAVWGVVPVAALCYLCFGLYPAVGMHPIRETRQLTLATALAFVSLLTARIAWTLSFDAALSTLAVAWALATLAGPPLRLIAREILGRQTWWGQRARPMIFGSRWSCEWVASSSGRFVPSQRSMHRDGNNSCKMKIQMNGRN